MNTRRRKKGNQRPVGIIAEDDSDIQVLSSLIDKIVQSHVPIKPAKGSGCGNIVSKCHAWAQNLKERGCRYLLLVQDLDDGPLDTLMRRLTSALRPSPITCHIIIIPVREIEAWLLADHEAIHRAMKLNKALRQTPNPEAIPEPKEYLSDLIYRNSDRKRYINTLDNRKIAAECQIENLRRCPSFVPFVEFIQKCLGAKSMIARQQQSGAK
jgi:Domain of unknown function (DUF4276)